jgi:diguanylate cyclase (GGDEF)-like protein
MRGADTGSTVARRDVNQAAVAFPEPDPIRPASETLVESYRRLAEVFHHVLSEQSLENLLERVAETLAELVPYDDMHIYEADVPRRVLVPVFARGEYEEQVMRTRPAFGQGITGWSVVHRQPVLANEAHLDPRVAQVPGTPLEPEAIIVVPLIARGALKGALNIYRVGVKAAFDEDEFELAKWFGDAAALALDNAQVRARLEHQAQTDSLTGLYNHRHFHERLRSELRRANRAHDRVAVLMFDIDDFKRVNDVCGHAVGDEILVAVAEMTQSLVRSSDVVCRLGGEEFAIIMPSCGASDALGLARRLRQQLEAQPIDAAGEITLSMGIAQGPEHASNSRELVACAETAMMTAKARGKNRIVLFNEETAERPASTDTDRELRSIAHLKMLQSLANKLNRLNDVGQIGEAIASELRMLIDYHSCRVSLVEGDEVVPVTVWGDVGITGEELDALRVKVGVGITGTVAETGKPMLVGNALESEEGIQIPGTDTVDESVVAVPLRYGSRVIGVIFLSKLGIDQFDESDLRVLEVLASHASVALENARLYQSLRREADHAKAWLEFADAMSGAARSESIEEETVKTAARLLDARQCSLWLQGREGDFYCAASHGYLEDSAAGPITRAHVSSDAARTLIESHKTPFVLSVEEIAKIVERPEGLSLGPVAVALLHPGYGVRGWIEVREEDEGRAFFTDERLRLLEGLAYRASMALQKALLLRDQQQSAQVANAMLEFARTLAEADELEEIYERIAERARQLLGVEKVSLWLEDPSSGEVEAVAASEDDEGHRELVLGHRFPNEAVRPFAGRDQPYVLTPQEYDHVPGAAELAAGRHLALASFTFDGGHMGFLIAGNSDPAPFDPLAMKMLAGLADQAKLAIAGAR